MLSDKNYITIAIPVFERFDYFPDALRSAIDQTVKCNVIVVDNNSSHNKFEKYIAKLNLPNVKYFRNDTNVGMIENWNKCIEYTTTDWMTILHDDDMFSIHFAEEITAGINAHPNAISFLAGYEKTTAPKKILKHSQEKIEIKKVKPFHFLFGNITGFPGVVFNKSRIRNLKFVPSLYPASDYNFWYNLSLMQPILFIGKVLCFYRVSPLQDSSTAYKKVIEITYNYRKDYIKFRNPLFKFFSLFELYKLHQHYRRDYNIKETAHYTNRDLNNYFNLFSNRYVEIFIRKFIYRGFKKIFGIHTGYR